MGIDGDMREKTKKCWKIENTKTPTTQAVSAQELTPPSNFLKNRYICSNTPFTNIRTQIWGETRETSSVIRYVFAFLECSMHISTGLDDASGEGVT